MANNNRVVVSFDFKANMQDVQNQLNSLKTNLQQIIGQSSKINIGGHINKQLQGAVQAAQSLQQHLTAAFNVNTGQLDLAKFNASLNSSNQNVTMLGKQLLGAGAEGRAAFMGLATSLAQAEVPAVKLSATMSKLATTFANNARWMLSSSILTGFISGIREAVDYTKELNGSLTDIRIVTGKSAEEMDRLAKSANKMAKTLKASTAEVVKGQLIYYQQGDSAALAAKKAEITTKAANVSFGTSQEQMSEYLTAIWNSYQVGEEHLEQFVDVLAAVGATTATSMEEIATAMQKVAATGNAVGVSYEQLTATIATISSITRTSAEQVGTALKTIYARIGDLKAGGLDEDDIGLGQVSSGLQKVGVEILDTQNNIRDMGEVVEEIGSKWNTWTEAQQQAIVQLIAGKRQYTQMMALFENWDMYESTLTTAEGADGELNKQQEIWAESWEGASNNVKASLESLYTQIFNDDIFIGFLNTLNGLVSAVDGISAMFGGLGNVILMVAAMAIQRFAIPLSDGIRNAWQNTKLFFDFNNTGYQKLIQQQRQALLMVEATSDEEQAKLDIIEKQYELNLKYAALEKTLTQDAKNRYNAQRQGLGVKEQSYQKQAKSADKAKENIPDIDGVTKESVTENYRNKVLDFGKEKGLSKDDISTANSYFKEFEEGKITVEQLGSKIGNVFRDARINLKDADLSETFNDLKAAAGQTEGPLKKINQILQDKSIKEYGMEYANLSGKLKSTEGYLQQLVNGTFEQKTASEQAIQILQIMAGAMDTTSAEYVEFEQKIMGSKFNLEELRGAVEKVTSSLNEGSGKQKKAAAEISRLTQEVNDDAVAQSKLRAVYLIANKAIDISANEYKEYFKILKNGDSTIDEIENAIKGLATAISLDLNKANSEYDELIKNLKEVGVETSDFKNKTNDARASVEIATNTNNDYSLSADKMGNKLMNAGTRQRDFADNLLDGASILMDVTSLFSSIGSMMDTLSNPDASGWEKFMAIISTVSTGLMTVGMIYKVFSGIKQAEDAKMAASSMAALGIIGLIVAGITVAIVAITALFKHLEETSPEGQLKKQEGYLEKISKAADDAKQKYEELKSAIESLGDANKTLDSMTKGTQEYNDALLEVNSQVLSLIDNFPKLAKYLKVEDGRLVISSEGISAVQEEQQTAVQDLQGLKTGVKTNVAIAKQNVLVNEVSQALQSYVTSGYGDAPKAVLAMLERGGNTFEEGAQYLLEHPKEYAEVLSLINNDTTTPETVVKLVQEPISTALESYQKNKTEIEGFSALRFMGQGEAAGFEGNQQGAFEKYLTTKSDHTWKNYGYGTWGGVNDTELTSDFALLGLNYKDVGNNKAELDLNNNGVIDEGESMTKDEAINYYNVLASRKKTIANSDQHAKDFNNELNNMVGWYTGLDQIGTEEQRRDLMAQIYSGKELDLSNFSEEEIKQLKEKVHWGASQDLFNNALKNYDSNKNTKIVNGVKAITTQTNTLRDNLEGIQDVSKELNENDGFLSAETIETLSKKMDGLGGSTEEWANKLYLANGNISEMNKILGEMAVAETYERTSNIFAEATPDQLADDEYFNRVQKATQATLEATGVTNAYEISLIQCNAAKLKAQMSSKDFSDQIGDETSAWWRNNQAALEYGAYLEAADFTYENSESITNLDNEYFKILALLSGYTALSHIKAAVEAGLLLDEDGGFRYYTTADGRRAYIGSDNKQYYFDPKTNSMVFGGTVKDASKYKYYTTTGLMNDAAGKYASTHPSITNPNIKPPGDGGDQEPAWLTKYNAEKERLSHAVAMGEKTQREMNEELNNLWATLRLDIPESDYAEDKYLSDIRDIDEEVFQMNKENLEENIDNLNTLLDENKIEVKDYANEFLQNINTIYFTLEEKKEQINQMLDNMFTHIEDSMSLLETKWEHWEFDTGIIDYNMKAFDYESIIATYYDALLIAKQQGMEWEEQLKIIDKIKDTQKKIRDLNKEQYDLDNEEAELYMEMADFYGYENGDTRLKAESRELQELINLGDDWRKALETFGSIYEYNKELARKKLEYQQNVRDLLKEALELEKNIKVARLESEKTLLDGEYEITSQLREARKNINNQLQESLTMYQYLDKETRKLIFNEEDYVQLSKELNKIEKESAKLQKDYYERISRAKTQEDLEYITAQYERQNELLMSRYEIAQKELDVVKARTSLENTLNERNTQMFINGRWQWVADQKAIVDAQKALNDAEFEKESAELEYEKTLAEQKIDGEIDTINLTWEKAVQDLEGKTKTVGEIMASFSGIVDEGTRKFATALGINIKKGNYTVSDDQGVGVEYFHKGYMNDNELDLLNEIVYWKQIHAQEDNEWSWGELSKAYQNLADAGYESTVEALKKMTYNQAGVFYGQEKTRAGYGKDDEWVKLYSEQNEMSGSMMNLSEEELANTEKIVNDFAWVLNNQELYSEEEIKAFRDNAVAQMNKIGATNTALALIDADARITNDILEDIKNTVGRISSSPSKSTDTNSDSSTPQSGEGSNQWQYLTNMANNDSDPGNREWAKHELAAGRYEKGTRSALIGLHQINEIGEETFVTPDGHFRNFAGGEVVFTHEQSQRLFSLLNADLFDINQAPKVGNFEQSNSNDMYINIGGISVDTTSQDGKDLVEILQRITNI